MSKALTLDRGLFKDRLTTFLAISVLLHLLLILAMQIRNLSLTENKKSEIQVDLVQLDKDQIERIRQQVTESALTEKADKAADDAYLSKQTQVVREQTRAERTAAYRNSSSAAGQSKVRDEYKPTEIGSLGVRMNFKPLGNVGPGETAATSDYLKNIKNGAETMLNTKEFVFFSFYQRVRQQLEQYWEPSLREKLKGMFERGRKLASDKDLATKLYITLNAEGTITKLQVEGTSGYLDLDQAAIEAFNKAGPFPNPPRGMIEKDGAVHIEWDFVLKT